MGTESYVAVTPADAIDEKDFSCFQIDGMSIVICRLNDTYYALKNECSHALATFEDGCMRGYRLICPRHSGAFDVRDGSPCAAPAKRPIRTFPVRVVNGVVEVDLSCAD